MSGSETVEVIEKIEVLETAVGDAVVLEEVNEIREEGHKGKVEVTVELYGDAEHRRQHLDVSRDVPLLHVLDEGARKLDVKLLPDAAHPLDHLRAVYRDHHAGEPLNLEQTLGEFLKHQPVTHHLAVELALAIQVNTRWRVAPEKDMTPKAILTLAGLKPDEYSLYHPVDAKEPLPPDVPVKLHRGERFEAQRDGKYG
jgi:hypothetical protein